MTSHCPLDFSYFLPFINLLSSLGFLPASDFELQDSMGLEDNVCPSIRNKYAGFKIHAPSSLTPSDKLRDHGI